MAWRRWNRRRLCDETLALLDGHGEQIRKHLITDVVPFDEGAAFITELSERRRSSVQAVFAI